MALQGLTLFQIYKKPGLRPMGDMDLLIKADAFPRVVSLLQDIGFHIPNPVYPKNLFKNGLWLDIHTHILNLDRIRSRQYIFPWDLSDLWHRALPLFKRSKGLLRPDPLDNFIVLAAHTLKHSYSRMIWIVDLNESLRVSISNPQKWDQLVERTKFWKQEKTILYGFTILEGILSE